MNEIRFTKTHTGRYSAEGAAHRYIVIKDPASGTWELAIYKLDREIAGVRIQADRPVYDDNGHDTKTLAVAVAREFEALGEDYRESEHGYRARSTEAVIRAYDAA